MDAHWGPAVCLVVLVRTWALVSGQVRYSVPEEAKVGTVVGRLPQELGLEAGDAEARRLRVVWQGRRASVEVSGASGALVVSSWLDREELCGKSAPCSLRLEVLLERPLRVFPVELEVTDINDNAPLFPAARKNISMAELTTVPGSRFPLEGASDADIGANAQLSYTLSPSEHFTLDVKSPDENRKLLFLVLTKALDRETVPVHRLVLTASDGGRPSLTGTMEVVISVLDVNDNAPQFSQSVYKVQLPENAAEGTLVVRVNATDPDLGPYGDVIYDIDTFEPASGSDLFSIDTKSGEIRLKGSLDFEAVTLYDLQIKAMDKGLPPLSSHCSVELEVLDVNDNAPEVWVTSLSVPVPEDASVGTVVALLSVSDRDSGANGRVRCWVWPPSPFGLESRFAGSYSLVLREALDRERVSAYEVEVRAEDGGQPSLRGSRGVHVPVSDVNDNAPSFSQAVYTVLARENNAAGAELARLWARDPDEAENGRVSYSVWEGGAGATSSGVGWRPASSYVSVDAESGRLWAVQPLDYEELQALQFEVRAVDAGEPPLFGNATVQLFVVDENDNAPALLPPPGGGLGLVPPAGQVVAKIRAVDADSGYNAWLRYEVWEPRGKGPFRVGLYSGEVSTARALEEADGPRQRLVIVVRDHGEPSRSATATLSVSLVEGGEAALSGAGSQSSSGLGVLLPAEGGFSAGAASSSSNVWLVVAICAVSSVLVLALVLYGAARCAPRAAVLSGPAPATLVCASEVGSWSYSQRQSRSLCVAEGAGKSDLMVFSPNLPPPPAVAAAKDTSHPEPSALLDTVSSPLVLSSPPPFFPSNEINASFLASLQHFHLSSLEDCKTCRLWS
ncbi:protocadherin alpha-3-like [Dryobates pubescens]|uniref:protocadherin alpha-3-like n=1 Tax=Dryobates pubescens TaxID=118200 RepID=UPI0023B99515|nr:protocadherin alpha-3-like [Dryobates pubescens]